MFVLGAAGVAFAQGESEPANDAPRSMRPLPLDMPTEVNGVEAVCTGIGSDSRENPLWAEYSLRLEFAAGGRAYVSNEHVRIAGGDAELEVYCRGPWVLAKLPPGRYEVTAWIAGADPKSATVSVPATGQRRAVIHFPDIPAAESDVGMEVNARPEPEYEPPPPPEDEPMPPDEGPE
jgi:hypothetical protein